jgi:hypothetical protein
MFVMLSYSEEQTHLSIDTKLSADLLKEDFENYYKLFCVCVCVCVEIIVEKRGRKKMGKRGTKEGNT